MKSSRFLIISLTLSLVFFPYLVNASDLDGLLRQKAELERRAEASRQKAAEKKRESADLQSVVADIDSDISYTANRIGNTQDRMELTERVITELNGDIAKAKNELAKLDGQLKSAYVTLYELSQGGTAELLLSGGSLSDIISRAQYLESIQTSLIEKIGVATNLKDNLDQKKNESESQKASLIELSKELQDSKADLASQRIEKDLLLKQTQGEQAQYEALLKKLVADQESVDKQIYEARRRAAGNNEQFFYGGSGYPWSSEPNPAAIDPWFFYKRQCVSYTAWKFLAVYGKTFINTRPGQGSAWNWPNLARDQGYKTSSTPKSNSVVSWPIGQNRPYGHTAWVESVNADGTINVSEYNWVVERGYSERRNVNPHQYGTPTYITP